MTDQTLKLPTPPGFTNLVPFDKDIHGQQAFPTEPSYSFASKLNAVVLTTAEFVQAGHDYPIIFAKDETSGQYIPAAVTGLESGENLFVDESGHWQDDIYVPAYIRKYPLHVLEFKTTGDAETQNLVCIDDEALSQDGEPLFDANGEGSTQWQRFEQFLNEFDASRRATDLFARELDENGVLEVFEARAMHKSGHQYHMQAMYRVNEKALKKLPARVMKAWIDKNYMFYIYAHLVSLDNFQRMLKYVERT